MYILPTLVNCKIEYHNSTYLLITTIKTS